MNNILTNNFLLFLLNGNIFSNQKHKQELIKVAKMYIDKTKYTGKNDKFIFTLMIFHNISTKVDIF